MFILSRARRVGPSGTHRKRRQLPFAGFRGSLIIAALPTRPLAAAQATPFTIQFSVEVGQTITGQTITGQTITGQTITAKPSPAKPSPAPPAATPPA